MLSKSYESQIDSTRKLLWRKEERGCRRGRRRGLSKRRKKRRKKARKRRKKRRRTYQRADRSSDLLSVFRFSLSFFFPPLVSPFPLFVLYGFRILGKTRRVVFFFFFFPPFSHLLLFRGFILHFYKMSHGRANFISVSSPFLFSYAIVSTQSSFR